MSISAALMLTFAIAELVLAAGGQVYSSIISESGSAIRSEIGSLAKEIRNKLSKNQNLLAELQQAYQDKNAALTNKIFTGLGFGPRMNSIRKQISNNTKNYEAEMKKINDENASLETDLSHLDAQYANAGTSIVGNVTAGKSLDEIKNKTKENLNQNIQGGISNA